ncbi:unnamed protein product [Parnassius apollo]|uniref:Phosphodeoxyriboaldolase n=1 Tax=Parnassius apollo TaxID=110799 RepID=A0A8S3XT16_PARAO|nr:unnamed protein product [Parnassius apollo]
MLQINNKNIDKTNLQCLGILKNIYQDKNTLESQIEIILKTHPVISKEHINAWLLKTISLIDLTTLSGEDTRSNVVRLCLKAAHPLSNAILKKLKLSDDNKITTAAVCVYPTRVADAYDIIKKMGLTDTIKIASVATGFPSGLYPLESRLQEIKFAVENGATEIDVVLDRSLVLMGKWETLFNEVVQMRKACGKAHLKVILGIGELGSYENVYKASMVSMIAGADFIKTSTGKEAVNATLPVGLVMCRAIRNFYLMTGVKVGLKPAGGIKTAKDAVNWLVLVHKSVALSPAPATPTPSASWQPLHINTPTRKSTLCNQSARRSSRVQPAPSTPPPTSRRRLPLIPRSGVTVSPARRTLRARRRRTLTPFDRATSEFVAIENLRLRQEEKRDRQLYDLEARRIEVDDERNQVLPMFADITQAWFDHYRSKDNTEQSDHTP